ncbi:MAG: ABC transporter substrate-binding protein [Gemmatimonadales bacterium]|nr:ABC transporter substrate-binding protein [Gemmatimonadales bacterium]
MGEGLRIISLLPGATEMLVALGATDRLVGISHECDFPASVQHLPRVTTTPIDLSRSSAEIDRMVREATAEGRAVIAIDAEQLRALQPDLLVTQVLCDVCAVADGEAHRLAAVVDPPPRVVALGGRTLNGVWDDLRQLGQAIGEVAVAERVVAGLEADVASLRARFTRPDPVQVVVIEWLAPCFLAGHWTPDLVAAAGGVDLGAQAGDHSVGREWSEVLALDPTLVVIALCGFDEARARAELAAFDHPAFHAWLAKRHVLVLDGNALTSRPGPRLVEAIGRIGERLLGV